MRRHRAHYDVIVMIIQKGFGHCREIRHANANRTHGGVGVFVKEKLFEQFDVSVLDNTYDGILCLLFKDKVTEFCFTVYCCYLPPENSPYGRDSTGFFTHLLSQIYLNSYVNASFICGDLNCRVGDRQQSITEVDDIPAREIIDTVVNKHGEALFDLLIESRMVNTNGRVCGTNAFTSVSGRGKSVVDYFAVPHENINCCSSFNVHPIAEITDQCSLEFTLSESCKVPDHSHLTLHYQPNCI